MFSFNAPSFCDGLRRAAFALLLLGGIASRGYAQLGIVPTIDVQPLDQSVKKGGTAVFTVEASSLTTMSYQWYRNSNAIPGATSSTYTRPNVDFPDAGFYHVVIVNFIGSTKSDVAELVVLSNTAPVGVDDTFSTPEDVPLTVPATGVLGNDTDAEADSLTALLVSNVTHGTLSLSTAGGFTYTPSPNYNGSDSFSYRPRDPVATGNVAVVTINVLPVDDAPIARNDATNTLEDTSVIVRVLRNDSELDGENLTIIDVSPTNGTAVISGTNIIFTPSSNYFGTAGFSYTISDGISSDTAYVTITVTPVNDALVAVDDNYSTPEDVSLIIPAPGIFANDLDPDNGALSALLLTGPNRGNLILNADGSFNYTPNTNYNGNDSFTYCIRDGNELPIILQESAVNRVKIEIKNGQSGAQSFRHGTAGDPTYMVSKVVLYLSRESTAPNTNLNFNIGTGVNSGAIAGSSVAIAPSSITNISSGSTFQTYEIVFAAPVGPLLAGTTYYLNLECQPSNGKRIWSAYDDQNNYPNGTYYKGGVNDGKDIKFQLHGSTNSNTATVTINNTPVYDPPIAVNDVTNTTEDVSVSIQVLANDRNPDNLFLIITGVSTVDGSAIVSNQTNILFTPSANFNGTAVLSYTIDDGVTPSTASVTVTVAAVNDAPVAYNDAYTTAEDVSLTIPAAGVLANDIDVDSGSLTVLLVSNVSRGSLTLNANGSFSYTPNSNYNGTDSFTYRTRDGITTGNVATVTLTITPVNDVPIAVNDVTNTLEDVSVTIKVLANDSDVEGGPLVITGASTTNGTAIVSGTNIVFTPGSNFNGTTVFSYTISDGTNAATASVTVNVISVNDGPPVANNDVYTTPEDVPLNIAAGGILTNDTDPDNDPFTALLLTNPAHGSVSLNPNGSFTYTPATNYNGSDSFTYRATDGLATGNVATITINITPVNDAPLAVNDSATTLEDQTVTINVLANDSDVEGTALTLTGASTTNGSVFVSGPNIVFAPATNFFGITVLDYTVSDGSVSSTGRATVTVVGVDDPPIAVNDSVTTSEDTAVTINVLGNDIEPDRTPLAITGISTTNGTATLSGTNILFTPASNYFGTVVFNYIISDGTSSAPAMVTVTVNAVNDTPIGSNDSYNTRKNVPLVVSAPGVLANDLDVEGDLFTAKGFSSVTHGSLTLSNDGSFVYTPAANYTGLDSFTYRPKDAGGNGNLTTVTINVHEPPNVVNDSTNTLEDTSVTIKVLANDSDPEGAPLSLTGVFTTNGTASVSGTNVIFLPATNFNGTVALNYTVSDGAYSVTGRVTVTVLPVTDPPVTQNDNYTHLGNRSLSIPPAGILSNDMDVDGNALSASLVATVSHGSLTLNANGSFTYTPASNYFGADSFTYRAQGASATSAVTTVTLTIVDPTPLRFTSTRPTTNGCELTLSGPTVSTYVIFASSDLTTWSPIATNYTASGNLVFTDVTNTKADRRFYRAIVAGAQN